MIDFDLEKFDFNWVSDFINDDYGGDDHGDDLSSQIPVPPSLHPFSGQHPLVSNAKLPPPIFPVAGSKESSLRPFKERLGDALRQYFKCSQERHRLVQVWAPVKNGGRCVLITSGQPFVIDPQSPRLCNYRTASVRYHFSAMEDGEVRPELGLPGRVSRQRLPEWTPNVQFYRREEYLRLSHALLCDVQGSVALPVFEPSGRPCIGVIEIITTSMKINYGQEIDVVCKALEAVNLKSYEVMDHPQMHICNEGRQSALAEILEIITVVCETHKLPLAQTWVPCMDHNQIIGSNGSKEIINGFDGNQRGQVCMTTTGAAFYVVDARMWGFRDACAEHYLQEGQGVPGRALATRAASFSCDIRQFSKTEYPLVHYARLFGLDGSLAIYLKSGYTGDDDYILEFFLTPTYKDVGDQQSLVRSLLTTIKRSCHNLRVVIDYKLITENILALVKPSEIHVCDDGIADENEMLLNIGLHCRMPQESVTTVVCCDMEDMQQPENVTSLSSNKSLKDPSDHLIPEDMVKDTNENNGGVLGLVDSSTNKPLSRRGKVEQSIGLEVLQQHFAGSLKEAAKSLGVCPTTMKRICRKYGISRWPSRKIKKVNHSIHKLQRVIDSIPAAPGPFSPAPLKSPFPAEVGCQTMEHEPNFTIVQPDELKSVSETYSLLSDGNEALETRIPKSEKSAKQTSDRHIKGTYPTPPMQYPVAERSHSGDRSVNPADSGESGHNNSENLEATKLVTSHSVSRRLSNQKEDGPVGLGSSFSGDPCLDINREPHSVSQNEGREEMIVVKATYKDDLIRFRLAATSSLAELKEQIAKRLKSEVGSYDVKYLDDDQEWVLLTCEDDLKECIDISISCGKLVVRLLISDFVP